VRALTLTHRVTRPLAARRPATGPATPSPMPSDSKPSATPPCSLGPNRPGAAAQKGGHDVTGCPLGRGRERARPYRAPQRRRLDRTPRHHDLKHDCDRSVTGR